MIFMKRANVIGNTWIKRNKIGIVIPGPMRGVYENGRLVGEDDPNQPLFQGEK